MNNVLLVKLSRNSFLTCPQFAQRFEHLQAIKRKLRNPSDIVAVSCIIVIVDLKFHEEYMSAIFCVACFTEIITRITFTEYWFGIISLHTGIIAVNQLSSKQVTVQSGKGQVEVAEEVGVLVFYL